MECKFLDLLHEQVTLGRKGEGGFKKEAWTAIEQKFNGEMNMNLSKDNFKNKLKTRKQGYRIMKELRSTSGFAWNESTQSMDADDNVWEELLKRREFKNAKVFKRQSFQYYNDLTLIVGNDMAEGATAATAQEIEGHNMDEIVDLNDDYEDIHTPVRAAADLDDVDINIPLSNQCSVASGKHARSTSSSRRPKRKKASMASSMDGMFHSIDKLNDTLLKPQVIELGEEIKLKDLQDVYAALKATTELSISALIAAFDTFVADPDRAKGFLIMNEEERAEYVRIKFLGL